MFENEALFPNEFNRKNDSGIDILSIIENDDKIDLIDIQANDLLTEIKRMIKVDFAKSKSEKIDADFLKSLKKVIVISNNNVSKEYLKKLSYIYFALYNDTLDVYYDIQKSGQQLEYYMLDEKYNKQINLVEDYDWSKYNCNDFLKIAYYQNSLDELLSILKINPKFNFWSINFGYALEKSYINNLISIFGVERIAKSTLKEILIASQEKNLEYAKELMKINPNIVFNCEYIFNKEVKEVCDINQIAFFTDVNKMGLKKVVYYDFKDCIKELIIYYCEIIKHSPDFKFDCLGVIIDNLLNCVSKSLDLAPSVFAQLTQEEHELFHSYRYATSLSEKMSFNRYISKLKNKYPEPKQLKLR